MNLSCPISRQEYSLKTLVIIDTRHSLYDYRRPFKDFLKEPKNQDPKQWLQDNTIYNPLLKQFLKNLKDNTPDYFFCFFHKDRIKNQILIQQFEKLCETNNIIITNKIIECNKSHIKYHLLKAIKSFFVKSKLQGQIHLQFSEGILNQTPQLHNLVIVTHNPISFQFASLLSTLNQLYIFKHIRLAKCLYSSYFHDAKKKFIIENHFYKFNFRQNFHHISSLNQLISLIEQDAMLLKSDSKVNVGYYFYPKKQNELIQLGVLQTSHRIKLVPIDLRFINTMQYDKIHVIQFNNNNCVQVIFQKILDLNKKKEIKFTSEEVIEMKKNYEILISTYQNKIYNIDPIHTIPIIAERVQFIKWFDSVINSSEFQKVLAGSIRFKTPKQEIYDNNSGQMNGLAHQIQEKISYPFIIKSRTAAFTSNCHIMAIVINDEGFQNALNEKDFKICRCELLIQEYVNHDSLIYKIYCLGDHVIIQKRKSVPNIDLTTKIPNGFIKYDSQQNLAQQVQVNQQLDNNFVNEELKHEKDLFESLNHLAKLLSKKFQVSLFGFDVIGDLKKLEFYLIDINHFPGYKNVARIKELFDDLFIEKSKLQT